MTTNFASSPAPIYGPRLGLALKLAADAFALRLRKGSQAPYLTHLLAVTSLVMDFGGSEDQMVAAVLHDLVEDIKPKRILAYIDTKPEDRADVNANTAVAVTALRRVFGLDAVRLVLALSDSTDPGQKVDWATRKRAYVARLRTEGAEVKLVCAADKIHNMQSIVRDFGEIKHDVFTRFGDTTVHDHLWYYSRVRAALTADFEHPITNLLNSTYTDLAYILETSCHADSTKSCAWRADDGPRAP